MIINPDPDQLQKTMNPLRSVHVLGVGGPSLQHHLSVSRHKSDNHQIFGSLMGRGIVDHGRLFEGLS